MNLDWNEEIKNSEAQRMFDKMFYMKFLPPGRGLWAMGTSMTLEKELYAALNNCAFVSNDVQTVDQFLDTFLFMMEASMLGIGVGFDTKGKGRFKIYKPEEDPDAKVHVIGDTREAWVESLKVQLESYMYPDRKIVKFDYTQIRAAGEPLKTFGGVCPGFGPLKKLHEITEQMFTNFMKDKASGEEVFGTRQIVDINNFIGQCVVAGNIRRTAEIAFGESDDREFIDLKNYDKNPERMEYGWVSNNSIFGTLG